MLVLDHGILTNENITLMKEVSFTIVETCYNSLTESTNIISKEQNSDKNVRFVIIHKCLGRN